MSKSAKLISVLVACMLLFTVAEPALAWSWFGWFRSDEDEVQETEKAEEKKETEVSSSSAQVTIPSNFIFSWKCTICGKKVDSDFGKLSAGACSGFIHDWVQIVSSPLNYQQQRKETERQQAAETWMIGHSMGWW